MATASITRARRPASKALANKPRIHPRRPKRPANQPAITLPEGHALFNRPVWTKKSDVLTAGAAVQTFSYQRTSGASRGRETSVEDQEYENGDEITERRWSWLASFTDNAKSAGRLSRKVRVEMVELRAAILAGYGDVLVFCEITRQTRQLKEYADLVEICRSRERPLRWWLVGGTLYDLEDPDDQVMLGIQALFGARESELAAKRNRRSQKGSAKRGRPHGPVRYGYTRRYDRTTGELAYEGPDTKIHTFVGEAGTWTISASGIVKWIYGSFVNGFTTTEIRRSLHDYGVPSPSGDEWWKTSTISYILSNQAYTGVRVHKGEVSCEDAMWKRIITADMYALVQSLRAERGRRHATPVAEDGKVVRSTSRLGGHLCGKCGKCFYSEGPSRLKEGRRRRYRCTNGCVTIDMELADAFVLRAVCTELATGRWSRLFEADTRSETTALHAEAERIRALLADWRTKAQEGKIGSDEYVDITGPLKGQLRKVLDTIQRVRVPAVLEAILTAEDAAAALLALDVERQRHILQACVKITLHKAAKRGRGVFDPERLQIQWVTDADMTLAA